MDKKQLVFTLCLVGYLLASTFAYAYALPPDPAVYWVDYFDKADVYPSTQIFNANWTYVETQNFTVSVSSGLLTIKYATAGAAPHQALRIWRGTSKNEYGIHLLYKIAKTDAKPFRLGLTADGNVLHYYVSFEWDTSANKPGISVSYRNMSGQESVVSLGTYQYSDWIWVDLTYKTPAWFGVKIWRDANQTQCYTWNTTNVRYDCSELWATGIFVDAQTSGATTEYFYVDFAEFSAPGGYYGTSLEYIYPIVGLLLVVGMLGAALKFVKV